MSSNTAVPEQTERFVGLVTDVAGLQSMPEEYRTAINKIVASHVVNEITGAQRFDEPAIALAPTPNDKWLTCRIAMEEYGHHVKFDRLATELNVDPALLDLNSRHNSMFDQQLQSWEEFIVFKAICDMAEIIQVEDLSECTYLPLRDCALKTMPEERFHAGFGRSRLKELVKTEEGRAQAQLAVNQIYPNILPFFGNPVSRNNEIYRRWGLKLRTNGEMREEYVRRVQKLVEGEMGLILPQI